MSVKLKLNTTKLKFNIGHSNFSAGASATPASPAPASAATPGGTQKISLKIRNSSQPSTPAPATPAPEEVPLIKTTKLGRISKPTAKIAGAKRLIQEESDSDDENSTIAVLQPQVKKIKLKTTNKTLKPAIPKTNITFTGNVKVEVPKRSYGAGYDSEASDTEKDPLIEEEFILRMPPGDDCDYLRNAIAQKQIGVTKDVSMKFFHADGRRAAITVRGNIYAATLVDLPCIIEGMKSWDKKGWWKAADICQMLWVFAPIKSEDVAKTIDLPKDVDPVTFQYPHGLTPPMHFARKRRFRKRISRTTIEAVEDEVARLLKADDEAISTRVETVDPGSRQGSRAITAADSEIEEYTEDDDAEGDEDPGYFTQNQSNPAAAEMDEMDGLEDELAAALEQDSSGLAVATPSSALAITPSMVNSGDTPMADVGGTPMGEGDEDEEDEDDDDDDSGDEQEEILTEEQKAEEDKWEALRADIAQIESDIEKRREELAAQPNTILKKRIEQLIRNSQKELNIKKSSLPEDNSMGE